MEDRRAAFPTHDAPADHNILDGPYMRTENDPINVVHKRYWALLVVGVLCIGLFSFYAPVGIYNALHCDKDTANFVFSLSEGGMDDLSGGAALNVDAVSILTDLRLSHMMQQDADVSAPGIFVYPAEDTNYVLYAGEQGAYVLAADQMKFRYRVKDDNGALYHKLLEATGNE